MKNEDWSEKIYAGKDSCGMFILEEDEDKYP
jgi:hypothetical protein